MSTQMSPTPGMQPARSLQAASRIKMLKQHNEIFFRAWIRKDDESFGPKCNSHRQWDLVSNYWMWVNPGTEAEIALVLQEVASPVGPGAGRAEKKAESTEKSTYGDLTARVLECRAKGLSQREIAAEVGRTRRTVRTILEHSTKPVEVAVPERRAPSERRGSAGAQDKDLDQSQGEGPVHDALRWS